jgi:ubiquitin-protein ligase
VWPPTTAVVVSIPTSTLLAKFASVFLVDIVLVISIAYRWPSSGTWRGEPGEQWSIAQGLESVLVSIQSLMSSNPYENEPGFEMTKITSKDAEEYAQKVCCTYIGS